jgi:hypothetical protein
MRQKFEKFSGTMPQLLKGWEIRKRRREGEDGKYKNKDKENLRNQKYGEVKEGVEGRRREYSIIKSSKPGGERKWRRIMPFIYLFAVSKRNCSEANFNISLMLLAHS